MLERLEAPKRTKAVLRAFFGGGITQAGVAMHEPSSCLPSSDMLRSCMELSSCLGPPLRQARLQ